MLIRIFILFLIVLLGCKDPEVKQPPKAVKGILDLRSVDFEREDSINLDGEWEFYWQTFLPPNSFLIENEKLKTNNNSVLIAPLPGYINVPGVWNDIEINGKPLEGKGYATYRLRILLPSIPVDKIDKRNPIGIKIPDIDNSYNLWINGILYGKGGVVSAEEKSARMGNNTEVFLLHNNDLFNKTTNQNTNNLDIQIDISNYHHRNGGLRFPIKFGDYKTLANKDFKTAILDFFLFGSILIMGLYHLGLYFLRRKDASALWFGIYCIMITHRILLTGEKYLEKLFPEASLFLLFLEYIEFVFLVPVFANFLFYLFQNEFPGRIKNAIFAIALILSLPVIILPSFYYTKFLSLIQIYILLSGFIATYVLILTVLRKRRGAKTFLFGWLVFFLTFINDILFYQFVLNTGNLFPFGLFVFIFSQAATLSMRFSSAFATSEKLSDELSLSIQTINEKENQYKSLMESLSIGVYRNTGGARGEFLQANPAMAKIFGYENSDEFMKIHVSELYENPEERKKFVERMQKDGECQNVELRLKKKNGNPFWGNCSAKVNFDSKGQILYMDGTIEDITKLKQATDSLIDLNATLEMKILDGIKEQQKYSSTLLELNKSNIISEYGLEKALNEITETCAKILNIERSSVWLFNDTLTQIQCNDLYLSTENLHSKGFVLSESDFPAYFEFMREGLVLSAPNIYAHPATIEFKEVYSKPLNIQSLLDAPIRSSGKLVGVVCLEQTKEQKNWTNEEQNFASSLASIIANLLETNQKESMFHELKKTKQEVEDLNRFTNLINSYSDLELIFMEISRYVYDKFQITGSWLFLPDEKREYIKSFKIYSYDKLPEENYTYLQNLTVPLDENGGFSYLVWKRQRPFYLNSIPKFEFGIDQEIVKNLEMVSFLYVPLVLKGETIGMYGFSNKSNPMKLSKSEIQKINTFCAQISPIIYNTNLLIETVKQKKETERNKRQTEELNQLIKSLNEDLNLNTIMQKVNRYVRENFGIQNNALYAVNSAKTHLDLLDATFPDYISEDARQSILDIKIPIQEAKGAHAFVYKTSKYFYIPNISTKRLLESAHEVELFVIEKYNLKSMLLIPLILNNELIGILDFSNSFERMSLTKEDITRLSILGEQLAGIIHGSNLFKQIQEEKDKAEKAKQETEKLNELAKKINSSSDLNTILEMVFNYFEKSYELIGFILGIDKKENRIYTLKTSSYDLNPEEVRYAENISEKISSLLGSIWLGITKKRTLYVTRYQENLLTNFDKQLISNLRLKGFFQVPLVIADEVIGLALFTSRKENFSIEKNIRKSVEQFCEQIAGAIYNAKLLEETKIAQKETENQKQQIESLNQFLKLINSAPDISVIFKEVRTYLVSLYGFTNIWILLYDTKTNELYSNADTSSTSMPDEVDTEYFKNFREKLDESIGTLYKTFIDKVPLSIPNLKNTVPGNKKQIINEYNKSIYTTTKTDLKIVVKGKLLSLIQIPMLLHNEVIGILNFSTHENVLSISNSEIDKLSQFANQIAGVIYNAQLLNQTEEAKKQADIEKEKALLAQQETEKQKQLTEELSTFIKSLNEELDLKVIMQKVRSYIKKNYNIHYCGLGIFEEEYAKYIDINLPEFLSEEDVNTIRNLKTKFLNVKGAHAFSFKIKKPVYVSKIKTSNMTEEEIIHYDFVKFQSFLIIPLVLQNIPIAFLDLYNIEKMELTKDAITRLSILGEQLAGIIHSSNLFNQVQIEKEKALVATEATEKAKSEIEALNDFLNLLNSTSDLSIIFKEVHSYLDRMFGFSDVWVLMIDKNRNELYADKTTSTTSMPDKVDEYYFKHFREKLNESLGTLYKTYTDKVPFYVPNFKNIVPGTKNQIINEYNKNIYIASKTDIKIAN